MSISRVRLGLIVAGVCVVSGAVAATLLARAPQDVPGHQREASSTVARRDFVKSVRLSGSVEAVEATTISTPRLAGQNNQSLVITSLVRPGTMVRAGDLVVEFDRQDQLKNALDRRVELNDLEQQIRKKQAEGNAARARDDSELMQAQSSLGRAQLEILKNEMLPKIQAEKNTQALEEAQAKVRQLKTTLRPETGRGRRRPADPPDSPRPGRERDAPGREQRRSHGDQVADRRHGRPPLDLEVEQHGGGAGRGGGPQRHADRRRRESRVDARARESEPGGHRRAEARAPGTDRPRRVSRPLVHRPGQPDLAARRSRRRCRPRCATSSP